MKLGARQLLCNADGILLIPLLLVLQKTAVLRRWRYDYLIL